MAARKTVDLGYQPRAWQLEVHKRRKRFSVLALHRRAGKTKLGVMELVDKALRFDKPMGLFLYVAPELKQATSIAWRELKSTLTPLVEAGGATVREGDLSVTFLHNGAVVRLYGADNPDAMRGLRLDGVVMDEVAQMKPEVWRVIVQPALADRLGWALFIGTPNGLNLFSELFFKATERMSSGDELWYAARWTVEQTEALDPGEINRLRPPHGMDENEWAREFLCDFTAGGVDQLIPMALAETAAGRHYPEHEIRTASVVMGVDPARFGDDRSVIILRQGLMAFEPEIHRGIDNMALADRVAALMEKHRPRKVMIDSGGGAGVVDRLRQIGRQVVEVPFGGKATDPLRFKNRRAEMWYLMREWLNSGGAIPDVLALKQELATPKYWHDSADRITLESKEQIKARLEGGGSPDIADALALTFAFPVSEPDPVLRSWEIPTEVTIAGGFTVPIGRGPSYQSQPTDRAADKATIYDL